jgi:Ca2+/Na+ antiporter
VALKLPLFSALILLAAGALVYSIFVFFTPKMPSIASSNFNESCTVLVVDETEDDNVIQNKLSSGGLSGFISESTQFVQIDDFGSFKFIPLDSFHSEIESFDPRDDGYAAKLRSFFVHEGKRFFFRLTKNSTGSPPRVSNLEKKLGAVLGGIPFTFSVLGQTEPVFLHYLLLAACCAFALFFSANRRLFIFQLPVLLATGRAGSFSIILAAILTGIWELLREPLLELFASRRYNRRSPDYAGPGFKGIRGRLKPFRLNLLFASLFFVFLRAFSFIGLLDRFLFLALCVSFAFFYFLSFKNEKERMRRRSHVQFTPVLLLPKKAKTFSFFPLLLPFAIFAVPALFLPRGFSSSNPVDASFLISPEDYNKHIAFQKSFSYTPLNRGRNALIQDTLIEQDYLRYYLGEDGLIAGNDAHAFSKGNEASPFPLEKLMDFLLKYNKPVTGASADFGKQPDKPVETKVEEWISVALIFIICLFDIIRLRIVPRKKMPIIGDKRIAA